jgi:hypothetical protein
MDIWFYVWSWLFPCVAAYQGLLEYSGPLKFGEKFASGRCRSRRHQIDMMLSFP